MCIHTYIYKYTYIFLFLNYPYNKHIQHIVFYMIIYSINDLSCSCSCSCSIFICISICISRCISMYVNIYIYILRFPEIGVPPNHPKIKTFVYLSPHGDFFRIHVGNSKGKFMGNSENSIVFFLFP